MKIKVWRRQDVVHTQPVELKVDRVQPERPTTILSNGLMRRKPMARMEYFKSPTCRPCAAFEPTVLSIANEYGVPLRRIDVSTEMPLAEALGIQAVPTLIIYDGANVERYRFTGQQARNIIAGSIANILTT
jgi:thioredoxin-like negative regulator of GroEL